MNLDEPYGLPPSLNINFMILSISHPGLARKSWGYNSAKKRQNCLLPCLLSLFKGISFLLTVFLFIVIHFTVFYFISFFLIILLFNLSTFSSFDMLLKLTSKKTTTTKQRLTMFLFVMFSF